MCDQKERKLPPLIPSGTEWNQVRKGRLWELFAREVYGEVPQMKVETDWELISEQELAGLGVKQKIRVILRADRGTYEFPLFLYIPEKKEKKYPVALYIENKPRVPSPVGPAPEGISMEKLAELTGGQGDAFKAMLANVPAPKPCDIENKTDNPYWPVEDLLKRGIAAAAFYTEDLAEDKITGYENGLFGFFGGSAIRGESSWGVISVWAYGASRAVDVLSAQPALDETRIAVVGHSRGGKTALWCAASDARVSCCYANNSGCTGAALSRGKKGEQLVHINSIFPYWFCEKYKTYNGREEALPIDQHMLLALIAPRPLYLASATEDFWADPVSEFLSAAEASKAYEALGLPGLCCDELPEPGHPCHDGRIGYHVREGGHALTKNDWMLFCDFWMKHWES